MVRDNDVIFQSPHQQHSFNFPYQLGRQEVDAASESPARAQVRAPVLFFRPCETFLINAMRAVC